MTNPIARDLIQRLTDELDNRLDYEESQYPDKGIMPLIAEARSYLAQQELYEPTDEELLALMPETMQDEFVYSSGVCSDAANYARAVLARYGNRND